MRYLEFLKANSIVGLGFWFLFILVSGVLNSGASAQSIHPKKKIFRDVEQWSATSVSKIKLKNFEPFRAVYDRTYKQSSGSNAGDQREDRVIVTAEEIGWDGIDAISITLIDSGNVEHKDTNARSLTMFVDRKNLSMLFEIGPIPGQAKDYYNIANVKRDAILVSGVMTSSQKLKTEKQVTKEPGMGPTAWALANSGLFKGKKIKLAPTYSPKGNPLTAENTGYIKKKQDFVDGTGKKHEAWILETTNSWSSSTVKHVHLTSKPPYYLGTEKVNLDTGDRKPFVWLRFVDLLNNSEKTHGANGP